MKLDDGAFVRLSSRALPLHNSHHIYYMSCDGEVPQGVAGWLLRGPLPAGLPPRPGQLLDGGLVAWAPIPMEGQDLQVLWRLI